VAAAAYAAAAPHAAAYTATLQPASPNTLYLQVGNGAFSGGSTYLTNNGRWSGATGAHDGTVNTVSVTVPAAVVGNGTPQTMTTDSSAANSYLDGYLFCNLPNQLYIGGYYRRTSQSNGVAPVVASVPANLVNASGHTIPFSQISWTSSGNGDGNAAQPFPAGSFVGGTQQSIGSFASNQWAESCWTFSYRNTVVPAGGVYTGTVTFTVTTP